MSSEVNEGLQVQFRDPRSMFVFVAHLAPPSAPETCSLLEG